MRANQEENNLKRLSALPSKQSARQQFLPFFEWRNCRFFFGGFDGRGPLGALKRLGALLSGATSARMNFEQVCALLTKYHCDPIHLNPRAACWTLAVFGQG
jgi:hypothetical protein